MGYVPDVMRKNVYDANENQKVDSAEDADTVDGIDGSEILKKDGSVAMTGDLNMGGNSITNALKLVTDTIDEKTTDSGVTIDGCLIKDGKASTDIAHISDIPGPIDSILTDHNKATHDALGIAWTSLTGTPSSFSGQKGMIPRVKSDETGLEFKHNAIPTTFVVAANDAKDKLRSDYACDGTADQTEINNAINALPT